MQETTENLAAWLVMLSNRLTELVDQIEEGELRDPEDALNICVSGLSSVVVTIVRLLDEQYELDWDEVTKQAEKNWTKLMLQNMEVNEEDKV